MTAQIFAVKNISEQRLPQLLYEFLGFVTKNISKIPVVMATAAKRTLTANQTRA